jgi:MFS family permease
MSDAVPPSAVISHRRVYLLLCGSIAAQALGQSAMFAVLPSIGREVGLLEIQVGAIIAASSLVFFFAGPYWGRASDRFGRRKIFLIGQLGYVIGGSLFAASFWFALEGLMTPFYAWLCMIGARMTQATLMSASQPAAGAYVADITGAGSRAKGLARIGAANNLGSIAGPAIGGLLATVSLLAPFFLAVACVAVAAVLSWIYLPPAPRAPSQARRPKVGFTDPRLLPWIIPGILMFMGAAVVQQTLSFRIQDSLHLDAAAGASAFGYTMVGSAIAGLLAQSVIVQRVSLSPAGWLVGHWPAIDNRGSADHGGVCIVQCLPFRQCVHGPWHGLRGCRLQCRGIARSDGGRAGWCRGYQCGVFVGRMDRRTFDGTGSVPADAGAAVFVDGADGHQRRSLRSAAGSS